MGNTSCCCGKPAKFRSTLTSKGQACCLRIPDSGGFFSPLHFLAYDALETEPTVWLSLNASGHAADAAALLSVESALPTPLGLTRPPLMTVEVGPWLLRKLPHGEARRVGQDWEPEAYSNIYTWEASRELLAFHGRKPDGSAVASLADGASGLRPRSEGDPMDGGAVTARPADAALRVAYLGLAGSTNVAEALAEILSGDADLETGARTKDHSCTLTLGASPDAVQVPLEANAEQRTLTLRCAEPCFEVTYAKGEVRVDVSAGADPLVACALGFATAVWANPWVAEGVAAAAAEENVRRDLQWAVALSLSSGP